MRVWSGGVWIRPDVENALTTVPPRRGIPGNSSMCSRSSALAGGVRDLADPTRRRRRHGHVRQASLQSTGPCFGQRPIGRVGSGEAGSQARVRLAESSIIASVVTRTSLVRRTLTVWMPVYRPCPGPLTPASPRSRVRSLAWRDGSWRVRTIAEARTLAEPTAPMTFSRWIRTHPQGGLEHGYDVFRWDL